ncbi:MAG TPA: hypothetical protein VGT44_02225 [Ktedonobacteraceae bacterium]|nr:hypothetical protein [Ktedonobacteraceae bacterium]
MVLLENLPWLLFPIYIIYRMWRYPTPFSRPGEVVGNLVPVEQKSVKTGVEGA